MRVVVAGGRDLRDPHGVYTGLVIGKLKLLGATRVLSGGATGADKIGEYAALMLRLPVDIHEADWDKHGRVAGPLRNAEMAEIADYVILLPGGKGTESMRKEAAKALVPTLNVSIQVVYHDNLPH